MLTREQFQQKITEGVRILDGATGSNLRNAGMPKGMDIFSKRGRLWQRESEEHLEYAHEPQMLEKLLNEHGFIDVRVCTDCPQGDDGRIFIIAKNTAH